MEVILGKWVQEKGQAYEGLWFDFKPDGTFEAEYAPMGIESGGTYAIEGNQIDMDQTTHTLGLIGYFKGIYKIEKGKLFMVLAAGPGMDRPKDFTDSRIYIRAES
jgi:hypothetical protein